MGRAFLLLVPYGFQVSDLSVSGAGNFGSSVSVVFNIHLIATSSLTPQANLASVLSVCGAAQMVSSSSVNSIVVLSSALSVYGILSGYRDISVYGPSTLFSSLSVTGCLSLGDHSPDWGHAYRSRVQAGLGLTLVSVVQLHWVGSCLLSELFPADQVFRSWTARISLEL
jgi:hypothetical protein